MSLLRLLTAGRSLVGLKKTEVRYHLPDAKALPRFGSKKNPFRATVLPEKVDPAPENLSPSPEAQLNVESAGAGAGVEAAGASVAGHVKCDYSGDAKEDQEKVNPDQPIKPPATTGGGRGAGLKAFLLWGRARKSKPRGGAPRGALVQGELSLDRVKVVRNDLSESDLEVVRASQAEPSKVPAGSPAIPAKTTGVAPAWSAAAGRLLGLNKK